MPACMSTRQSLVLVSLLGLAKQPQDRNTLDMAILAALGGSFESGQSASWQQLIWPSPLDECRKMMATRELERAWRIPDQVLAVPATCIMKQGLPSLLVNVMLRPDAKCGFQRPADPAQEMTGLDLQSRI